MNAIAFRQNIDVIIKDSAGNTSFILYFFFLYNLQWWTNGSHSQFNAIKHKHSMNHKKHHTQQELLLCWLSNSHLDYHMVRKPRGDNQFDVESSATCNISRQANVRTENAGEGFVSSDVNVVVFITVRKGIGLSVNSSLTLDDAVNDYLHICMSLERWFRSDQQHPICSIEELL